MVAVRMGSAEQKTLWSAMLLAACWACLGSPAEAQLFGNRTVGQPLQRRPGATAGVDGQVQGNERFIRGNRGNRSFVGADRQDTASFVGNEQARVGGPVVSSTAGIQTAGADEARINQPLRRPPRGQMYLPQVELGFAPPAPSDEQVQTVIARLNRDLQQLSPPTSPHRLEVSVVAQTAILRGEVTAAGDRELAELLVLFEPGIEQVQNEIRVVSPR